MGVSQPHVLLHRAGRAVLAQQVPSLVVREVAQSRAVSLAHPLAAGVVVVGRRDARARERGQPVVKSVRARIAQPRVAQVVARRVVAEAARRVVEVRDPVARRSGGVVPRRAVCL